MTEKRPRFSLGQQGELMPKGIGLLILQCKDCGEIWFPGLLPKGQRSSVWECPKCGLVQPAEPDEIEHTSS